jgi:hypothetical protein
MHGQTGTYQSAAAKETSTNPHAMKQYDIPRERHVPINYRALETRELRALLRLAHQLQDQV